MNEQTPRIAAVAGTGDRTLLVTWKGGRTDRIDLSGWIATGGDILAPLNAPSVFRHPSVGDYGASVLWEWDGDELAIDAVHLEMLAAEQQPFTGPDVEAWQAELGLSNQEAARFLGIAVSTWHTYKSGGNVPAVVGMVCRAARRDPILMQAHFRPLKAGRPRREQGA